MERFHCNVPTLSLRAQNKQGDLPLSKDPVLTVDGITKKRNELFSVSNPIMTKPKPKPAPAPAPAASPAPAPAPAPAPSEGKADDSVPMDTDTPAGEAK